ncbi:MAG: hypothetical protein AAGD00_11315 [Planctomycetota bacterium]
MRDGVLAGFLCTLAIIVVAGPLALLAYSKDGARGAYDQNEFHKPVIESFSETWPAIDMQNYASATTPGYHWLLAGVAKHVSDDERALRVLGLLWSAALAGLLGFALARRTEAGTALVLALPTLASVYVVSSAAFLLPDNAGWLLVLAILLCALDRWASWSLLVLGAGALVALVLVRQSHVWAAALLWIAAWVGRQEVVDRDARDGPVDGESPVEWLRSGAFPPTMGWGGALQRFGGALALTLPAFAVLGWFVLTWGGLVPPMFQGAVDPSTQFQQQVQGPNPAMPAMVLAVFGVVLAFHAMWWLPGAWRALQRAPWVVLVPMGGAVIGAAAGLLPATSYSLDDGRYGGIWALAKTLVIADRSLIIAAMSTLGGAGAGGLFLALPRRAAWVIFGGGFAFTLAQTANAYAWQRYCEPMLLIITALSCTIIVQDEKDAAVPGRVRTLRVAGPSVLAALLAAVTVMGLV